MEIKVTKITRQTSAKATGNCISTYSSCYGFRSNQVTLYQATATYKSLIITSMLYDTRKKAIEGVTRDMNSLIKSAQSQGLI